MKRLLLSASLFLLLAVQIGAQGIAQPASIGDITGNSAAQQISASVVSCRWVLIIALTTNTTTVRVGDSNVGANRGAAVAAGGGLFFPPLPTNQNPYRQNIYDLSKIYFYGTASDKVAVVYGI